MKKYSEYAPMRLHLRMEMLLPLNTLSLFFQVRGLRKVLPDTAWKESEWQSYSDVTDLGHCFAAHTRPALPSFVERRFSLDFCCPFSSLRVEAPPRPGPRSETSVPFREHSAMERAPCVYCLATSRSLLKITEAPLLCCFRGSAQLRIFFFSCFSECPSGYCSAFGGGQIRSVCHQLSNQPWVSAHLHSRVPTPHKGSKILQPQWNPPDLSSASPSGVVLTRSDFCFLFFVSWKFLKFLFFS